MRIDQFLNAVNIVKKRSIASDMCKSGVVQINDIKVKSSKEVKIYDIIAIVYLDHTVKYKVLKIPTTKTTPKDDQEIYVGQL